MKENIEKAMDLVMDYGGIDGKHHKQWLIDQVVRALAGNDKNYQEFVRAFEDGEDGPQTYEWDTGVAP